MIKILISIWDLLFLLHHRHPSTWIKAHKTILSEKNNEMKAKVNKGKRRQERAYQRWQHIARPPDPWWFLIRFKRINIEAYQLSTWLLLHKPEGPKSQIWIVSIYPRSHYERHLLLCNGRFTSLPITLNHMNNCAVSVVKFGTKWV